VSGSQYRTNPSHKARECVHCWSIETRVGIEEHDRMDFWARSDEICGFASRIGYVLTNLPFPF
jgi:hypothetical protein